MTSATTMSAAAIAVAQTSAAADSDAVGPATAVHPHSSSIVSQPQRAQMTASSAFSIAMSLSTHAPGVSFP